MRALLDVNVLVALLDASHLHHRRATDWLLGNARAGWASCPLTQNGCLRILSQPAYPNAQPAAAVAQRLSEAVSDRSHQFWPDALSLLEAGRVEWQRVLGPRQITDAYLLALAVSQRARLVTFDRGVPLEAIAGAQERHLLVLD